MTGITLPSSEEPSAGTQPGTSGWRPLEAARPDHRADSEDRLLSERGAWYETLVDGVPDPVVIYDPRVGRFVDANRSALALFGRGRDTLLEVGWVEVSPPVQPDGTTTADRLRDAVGMIEKGFPYTFRHVFLGVGGHPAPCEVRAVPLPAVDRMLLGATIRQGSDALPGSAARRLEIRRLAEVLPVPFAFVDVDGRYEFGNAAHAEWLGVPRDAIAGQPVNRFLGDAVRDTILGYDTRGQGTLSVNVEALLQRPGQERRHVHVVITPHRADTGGVTGFYLLTSDATDLGVPVARARAGADQFRELVEGSVQGVLIHRDFKPVFANQAFATIHGYGSAEEILGLGDRALSQLVAPDEHERMREYYEARLRGEHAPAHYEYKCRRADGTTGWVQTSVAAVVWDGRPAVQATIVDITRRKEAEAALRESEARYRSVVEGSLEGILIQQGGVIEYANPACARMFGYPSPDALIGREVAETLFSPEAWDAIRARIDTLYRGEILGVHSGWPGLRQDGSRVWIASTGSLIIWRGQPAMLSFYTDITEIRQAQERLARSEELLRTVVHDMPALVCRFQLDGTLSFVNQTYCDFFQRSPDDLIGHDFFRFIPQEEQPIVRRHFSSLDKERPAVTYEHKVIAPDSTTRWTEWTDRALFDERGGVVGYQSVGRDVTPRKLSEAALQESERRYRALADENARLLEQARRDASAKGVLLQEVNHRVQNNLASIIGLVRAHDRFSKGLSPERWAAGLANLSARIEGLAAVHRMLSAVEWSALRVGDLAREVIGLVVEQLPPGRRATLTVECPGIWVTPRQANSLAIVLNELATNSIKHAGERRATHITLRVSMAGDSIRVEYRDDGPGYPESALATAGSIGLYLVVNLVRNSLRGHVRLRNDGGAVTEIVFRQGD